MHFSYSVFIGDCAPLSLFQTVRQIVTSRVDPHAFAETSRVSMLENVSSEDLVPLDATGEPAIDQSSIQRLVTTFLTVVSPTLSIPKFSSYIYTLPCSAPNYSLSLSLWPLRYSNIHQTSGLVDLFDSNTLIPEIRSWANQLERSADVTSAVHYLVLAIGSQSEDEQIATTYFLCGKHLALSTLAGNLSVGIVQSFLLTTIYLLRSCQINAAFLFFGSTPPLSTPTPPPQKGRQQRATNKTQYRNRSTSSLRNRTSSNRGKLSLWYRNPYPKVSTPPYPPTLHNVNPIQRSSLEEHPHPRPLPQHINGSAPSRFGFGLHGTLPSDLRRRKRALRSSQRIRSNPVARGRHRARSVFASEDLAAADRGHIASTPRLVEQMAVSSSPRQRGRGESRADRRMSGLVVVLLRRDACVASIPHVRALQTASRECGSTCASGDGSQRFEQASERLHRRGDAHDRGDIRVRVAGASRQTHASPRVRDPSHSHLPC